MRTAGQGSRAVTFCTYTGREKKEETEIIMRVLAVLVPLLVPRSPSLALPRSPMVQRMRLDADDHPTWSATGLSPALRRAAIEEGWHTPTAVQQWAIPVILDGAHCWAEAPTGSGKTAAFALPLLQRLTKRPTPQRSHVSTLVLAPTRELAAQTASLFRALSRGVCTSSGDALKVVALHGGVALNPQLRALSGGADVLVATPGRLLDVLVNDGVCLDSVGTLLLDEADRLLAASFEEELDAVLDRLPCVHQTLLFSATYAYATWPKCQRLLGRTAVGERQMGEKLMEPIRISGSEGAGAMSAAVGGEAVLAEELPLSRAGKYASSAPPATIHQRAISIDVRDRTPLLRHLLTAEGWARVLVFVGTQRAAEHVASKLQKAGHEAAALHGGLSQAEREARLQALRSSELQVLVATNVASRGLDVPGLEAIVNYELPRSTADYTHRVGRTGRAGQAGVAVSFVASTGPGNEAHFALIEKRHGGLHVPREVVEGFEPKDVDLKFAPADESGRAAGARVASGAADGAGSGGYEVEEVSVVAGVRHSRLGLAHDRMHGGVKGRRRSKKDKLREQAAMQQQPSQR